MFLHLKLIKRFRDISIKQKLYLCILMLVILPLILAGYYLNNQFTSISIHKTSETSLQILKQTKLYFENMIADTNDLSLRILSEDRIQKLTKGKYDTVLEFNKNNRDISNWLDDVIGSKTYFDSVSISRSNELLFQKGELVYIENPFYVNEAIKLEGGGLWTGAYNLKTYTGSTKVISFYRAINDFDRLYRNIGVERISITEETVSNMYKNINPYKGGHTFLVDSKGMVLSSTEKSIIGTDYSSFDYVNKALQNDEGFLFTKIANEKNVVLYYSINETGWHLIETIPVESIFPIKTTINNVIVIAVALCILFGLLFSLIQNNYLVKPLSLLLKEMVKLRKGNFNITLDTEPKDEIGEINRGFTRMANQLKENINEVFISKIKQQEAEFTALEAQINPHFLYNTLDSIHWLAVKNKDYDVSEQIEALSEIFKHVLNKGREIVTIKDELDLLENYMFIQKAKYGKRIKIIVDVDKELMIYKTPKLILQPLVENALLHGLEQKVEGGTIKVKVERIVNDIRYVVSDDGKGVNNDWINEMIESTEQSHNVFALKNIDDRIKLRYGQEYGLKFQSKELEGTIVEVLIPLNK